LVVALVGLPLAVAALRPAERDVNDTVLSQALWEAGLRYNGNSGEGSQLLGGECDPRAEVFECRLQWQAVGGTDISQEEWRVRIDDRGCWEAKRVRGADVLTNELVEDTSGANGSGCHPAALEPAG
jgi:hypothetical protein